MVDVVGAAQVKFQIDQVVDRRQNILRGQHAHRVGNIQVQLAVDLVTAHLAQVVALGIKEARIQQLLTTRNRRRFARSQLAVQLHQRFFFREVAFFFDRPLEIFRVTQPIEDFRRRPTQGLQQHLGRQFAGLVDPHPNHVVFVGLKLQPSAPVGNQAGRIGAATALVDFKLVVNAGATDDLIHDHPFRAVDDEGSPFRHQGQIANKDFLLLDFAGFFVDQPGRHIHLHRIGGIPPLGFINVVFGPLQLVVFADEVQLQLAGIVRDRGEAIKFFDQAFFEKPTEAGPLNFNQVGQQKRRGRGREFVGHASPGGGDAKCKPVGRWNAGSKTAAKQR